MDNTALAGVAGGVSGFADAFLSGMKEKRDREAAESKFGAYMELQRELAGNKTVTGQELFDYGSVMGMTPEQLKPIDLGKKYNVQLGLNALKAIQEGKNVATKEKGAEKRANIAAGAKKEAAGTAKPNTAFNPEAASKLALENAIVRAGYKKGTSLKALGKDKEKLAAVSQAYLEEMGGSIASAGQTGILEASAPFEVKEFPDKFWESDRTQIGVLPGFRKRAVEAAAQGAVAPAAATTPRIGATVEPTVAPTQEAVGADRKAVANALRVKMGLKPLP